MKTTNILFLLCVILALAGMAMLGINFNKLSENSLLQYSYGLIFLLVSGTAGLLARRKQRQVLIALLSGFTSLLLLIFFYIEIWPLL